MANEIYYDPFDYEVDMDPHPVWKRMREEMPLYYNDKFDFYALSRYEDVMAASKDWETFSSAYGTTLDMMRNPEMLDLGRTILTMDPPEHDQLRSLVGRRFTPKAAKSMEDEVREIVSTWLDQLKGRASFDFIQDFGALVPMMVICSFMGLPREDHDSVRKLVDASLHREEGQDSFDMDTMMRSIRYYDGALAIREFESRDDFISELITANVKLDDGTTRPLTQSERINFLSLTAGGGNETVARLLGWAGALLAEHPEQRKLLVDNPDLIPQAVEEILRFESPSPVQGRTVMKDIELHGTTIKKGSIVLLLTNSANRDADAYEDPDTFNIMREPKQHASFGFGAHFCVGAALARLEGRVALEETLKRYPEWDVEWTDTERVHTSSVRGYLKLPVKVTPVAV
jgi:cytochrome P450